MIQAAVVSCMAAEQRAETSVNPGINDSYLKEDIQVPAWVERFESEGREVFDHRKEIIRALGLKPGMAVADIGCGTGLFTLQLAKGVGESGQVYAVDIVEEFLRFIEQRADAAGWENLETVLCKEDSVELPAGSIDLAFICDAYHHFEYPRSTLSSIYRALRPAGQVVLVEFKRVPGESSDWILNHVRADQETFSRELQEAGFRLVEEYDFMNENYMVRFQKVSGPRSSQ